MAGMARPTLALGLTMPTGPQNTTLATVAVTRCCDYGQDTVAQAIEKQFLLLGGIDRFVSRGDSVLLKPNFIAPKPRALAVQTDPSILLEVARIVKDCGAEPFVADSPAWSDAKACVNALGFDEQLRKLGVPVRQLDRPKRCEIDGARIGISCVALEADKIINIPKFKTHQQLVATFAVKNMFGTVCGKEKAFWHFARGKSQHRFCKMLLGIYRLLNPVLTIIDGVMAMEGAGPINGQPRNVGFIIGSTDPIACETVCCDLIGITPSELPMIQTAKEMGFDSCDLSGISIIGDDYTQYKLNDFVPATQTPLSFSFGHICKSVAKQLLLLAKSAFKRS